ncbi:D-2-hydroxyacid dehydrogenase [Pectinatus haikarae]|uniref:Phosphoglycerate dehydrogenase-like enzyme n=1 Tax=Pectinatus haikarae TaxID=349096 RepID=A0ABT9Y464_9FIRM|nr:D-2-hydroxyacid dehydrogenase [Pectinatus haikarae]MDQ0202539.1 phosphoglycerate dehydrogenase-like enzyme [Pectinatus haikarae]
MHVLVMMSLKERHRNYLEGKGKKCSFIYARQPTDGQLAQADIIIGNPPVDRMNNAAALKWIQLNSAGAQNYCRSGVLRKGVMLTNATGAYGLAISEYMLAVLLAMQKKLYVYHDNQKNHLWQDEGEVASVAGSSVLVLGLGDIGRSFAKKVKALGAFVVGIKRRPSVKPEYVDELFTMNDLDECLQKADIVVNSLPGTDATYHLLGKEKFSLMKKGTFFINIGRGTSVITDDMCDAVMCGQLAGAAVDVTDPEPLPRDHIMWQIKNIHITPHTAGQYHLPATLDNIVKIAGDNLEKFLKNDKLMNEVDFSTGYKK